MRIKRALKCAAVKEQLEEVLEIAKKADIKGLEVQEILPQIEESSFEKRGETIIKAFQQHSLTSLVYHFPIKFPWGDISEGKRFDLASEQGSYVFNLTEDTIKEAALVGQALNIKTEIPIVVHLFGFAASDKITKEERNKRLELGEKRLKELKEIADFFSKKSGLRLIITRENNPPEHGKVQGLLDFHPQDIIRTADIGIKTCLDFAHLWLNMLYWKNGKGELPGVDLIKKLYQNIDFEETVDLLTSSLNLIHLNDAGPSFRQPFEGLEIGKGNFPHSFVIPLIYSKLEKDIIGTYEMKYGHKDPESILRSDQFYRNLFKEKFQEYFE